MGKIITVASQKGGVGKTTTSLNLGFSLSRLGLRVLIIDTDPQGGIGIASNLKTSTTLGLMDLLTGRHSINDIIAITDDKTMGIVGTGITEAHDVFLFEETAQSGQLTQTIEKLAEQFDYIVIDAPAGTGGIVSALLKASDSIILIVNCKNITIKTLPQFLKLIRYIQKHHNPALLLEGILITMFNPSSSIETQTLQEMRKTFPSNAFFDTIMNYYPVYEKASQHGVPVLFLSDGQKAGRSYIDLAMELRERELKTREEEGENDGKIVGLFGAA